jgi:tRNA pseudouridine38-40 synthase
LRVAGSAACQDGAVRLRIDLAYDGTAFHGWASQPGLRTVQATLEQALCTVLRVPEAPTTCAGRTDAGVHARGQVVHTDLPTDLATDLDPPEQELARLGRRLNGVLPEDVRVARCLPAAPGFDARFSALWRRYAYRVADADALPDPLQRSQVLTWPRALDVTAMNDAAAGLLGEHDFAAFCKRREGATTVRRLLQLSCQRDERGTVVVTVRADAFCHSMVRALVGCLVAVGEGRQEPAWAARVLAAEVRDPGVGVLAARGLTLEEVAYPPDDELAAQATRARVTRTL